MKIKIPPKKIFRKKENEVELGESGNFILIKSKVRDNYTFGQLEGIVKIQRYSYGFSRQYIKFKGDSYTFYSCKSFGIDFPSFHKRLGFDKLYDPTRIEEVVSGIDDIISFLEKKKHHGHADLIKKIRDAQKKR